MTTTSPRPRVTWFDDDRVVEVESPDHSLLQVSQLHRIPHMSECGGRARCTTCRVRCLDGLANLSSRTDAERVIAEARGWAPYLRLACQTRVLGDVVVQRIVRTPADASRLRVEERLEQAREVSLVTLFCDLRGFTPLAERHLPYDVVHLLNRYFEAVGEPILNNNGYIDMYVGDGLVAHFGLDGRPPARTCVDAVRAALLMQHSLEELNRQVEPEFGVALEMGIGVDLGTAIVGPVGHSSRRQLTAIGDSVNGASRIESATKSRGAKLLLSDAVMQHVRSLVASPRSFDAELKGRSGIAVLHEVTGFAANDPIMTVQSTFALVARERARFGQRFYENFFALSPALKDLFTTTSPEIQDRMFVEMLFLVVRSLSRMDELRPALVDLGARHVAYGTRDEHFDLARRALMQTLREMLGSVMTSEVEAAWSDTYDAMVSTIRRGMKAKRSET
jgi:class 3 adenylate cyclase/hemoglobin-like flavoprotein